MATATTLDFTKDTVVFMDDEYYTTIGALKAMGIGKTTLSKEIRLGNITPYNLPHGYAFSKASVREWMNNRRKKFLMKLKAKK